MKLYYGRREDYFDRENVFEKLINNPPVTCEVKSYKDAVKWINKKAKELNKTVYYFNCNYSKENNWIEIDSGSWCDFVLLYDLTEEDWKEFIG